MQSGERVDHLSIAKMCNLCFDAWASDRCLHLFYQHMTLVASVISFATSFFISLQSSLRTYSAAPRCQTEPAPLGSGLGSPPHGGFVLLRGNIGFTRSLRQKAVGKSHGRFLRLLCLCLYGLGEGKRDCIRKARTIPVISALRRGHWTAVQFPLAELPCNSMLDRYQNSSYNDS